MVQLNQRKSSVEQILTHFLVFHPGNYGLVAFGACFFYACCLFSVCLIVESFLLPSSSLAVTDHSQLLSFLIFIMTSCACALVVLLAAAIGLVVRMRVRPCLCGRMATKINCSTSPKLTLFLQLWTSLIAFGSVMSLAINWNGGLAGLAAACYALLFWSVIGGLPFLLAARSRLCLNFERDIRLVTDQHLLGAQLEKMSESDLIGLAKFASDFGEHTNASIITDQLGSLANLQIVGKSEEELQFMLKIALQDKNAPKAYLISKRLMVGIEDEVCN